MLADPAGRDCNQEDGPRVPGSEEINNNNPERTAVADRAQPAPNIRRAKEKPRQEDDQKGTPSTA